MRIIIADDHAIFRDGLKLLLGCCPGYQVVAESGEAASLAALVQAHRPDLLIMDYNMPGGDSGAVLAWLKQRYPALQVVVLTAERGAALLQHLEAVGADGILLKEGSGEALLAAIQRVAAGEKVVPPAVRERIDQLSQPDLQLTAREFQVLHLLCEGWPNAAIAERFALSPRTVDKHRENLQRKLGVSNVVQLINKARELNLIAGGA